MPDGGNHLRLNDGLSELGRLTVEQLRSHRIDKDLRRAVAIPPDQVAEVCEQPNGEAWIDIQANHPNDFQSFLEKLNLHPLIMEDCLDPQRSPRFSSYEDSLHFEVPVFSTARVDDYLSVISVPRLLITIRASPITEVDRLSEDHDQRVQLNDGTKSALLYAILDSLTDRLVMAATASRNEIARMSHQMDVRPTGVDVDKIKSAKRTVQNVTTIAEDQFYCIGALVSVDTRAFPMAHQRDYFRDATRNYEAALRVLHRYEARAAELHQHYLSSLQARTESRLRTLTVLSAIYMPLTLIAGIYGMNFSRMPELQTFWGYPATLIAMAAIATGQIWFFYKRGWFG